MLPPPSIGGDGAPHGVKGGSTLHASWSQSVEEGKQTMQNGCKIIGLDIHIIALPEMWEQYVDRACKGQAPKIVGRYPVGIYGLMEGRMLPTVDAHARERWHGRFRWWGCTTRATPHAALIPSPRSGCTSHATRLTGDG